MGVKGGTTSNTGNQFVNSGTFSNLSGTKNTTTGENTQQNINTNQVGTTNQNTYGQTANNTTGQTAQAVQGTGLSQAAAQALLAYQGSQLGRQAPQLGPLDINAYLNPYASYALQGLNQQLGVGDKRLASSNIAQSGGVGGDRRAVSEALNFQQDQLARGQLMAQIYGQAVPIAQQQQGAQYGAAQYGYQQPLAQASQIGATLAQLQPTLGQFQTGTTGQQQYGTTAQNQSGTTQNVGTQTADTSKLGTSNTTTNVQNDATQLGHQVGTQDQSNTLSPFQVGTGLLTSALAFVNKGGRIPHKAGGGELDDDFPQPPPAPQVHFANLFTGLPKAGEGQKAPDMSGIKPRDSAPYGGGNPFSAMFGQSAHGGSSAKPLEGLDASDYGPGYARGGSPYAVRSYATDGAVTDDGQDYDYVDPTVRDPAATEAWRQGVDRDRAIGVTQQADPLVAISKATGVPLASKSSSPLTMNYTDDNRPAPAPAGRGLSYSEWRKQQSGDSDMNERYKLPFGLSANKFLLRAGLGILGQPGGAQSNPVTAFGQGFTGALDAQQKEEASNRELYNQYLTDEQKERFHQDTVNYQNRVLNEKNADTPDAKFWREHAVNKLKQDQDKAESIEKYRIDQARARAEEKADQEHRLMMASDPATWAGASEAEKAANLNRLRGKYLLQEGIAAPTVRPPARTIVRSGTVNDGPNKGKRAIQYSDGTVEYQ